jgi:DNA-binding PadR family transcriptional regulator
MSLPHVLLGILAEHPRTGYDLARVIEQELEPVWKAEISQIYPALARLRREGQVVLRVLGPRRGPHRNLYRVTAQGRRELRRWLLESPPTPRGRDDGLARVAFLEVLPPPERRQVAPPPDGFRREAREAAIEKLEAARRWARSLSGRPSLAAPPASSRADGVGKKR